MANRGEEIKYTLYGIFFVVSFLTPRRHFSLSASQVNHHPSNHRHHPLAYKSPQNTKWSSKRILAQSWSCSRGPSTMMKTSSWTSLTQRCDGSRSRLLELPRSASDLISDKTLVRRCCRKASMTCQTSPPESFKLES